MSVNWQQLKQQTQARIGITRMGYRPDHLATLNFQLGHALARDAVWTRWDFEKLQGELRQQFPELEVIVHQTQVQDRASYLKRPDLGRVLLDQHGLSAHPLPLPLALVLSDGLSAHGMNEHGLGLMAALARELGTLFPRTIFLCPFSRVAIGDEIGELYRAELSLVIIGERPGLSAPDGLGAYLTYKPQKTCTDADRNCVSNIRPPHGLSLELAAAKIAYLIRESLRLKLSGVNLKEEMITGVLACKTK